MKSNLRKGISVLLCLAMVFAMIPNFSVIRANAQEIGSRGGTDTAAAETENKADSPEENEKTEGSDVKSGDEPVGNDQLGASEAGETNTTGTWADYTEEGGIKKYKYADFSKCLYKGKLIKSGNIEIYTEEQLAGLMVLVNANQYETVKDKNNKKVTIESRELFSECTIKLENDMNLSAHEWVPIGKDLYHSFSASLDGSETESGGNICKIQGMKIGSKEAPRYYENAGLIGCFEYNEITASTVSNVGIDNSEIYVSYPESCYVGGIVGYVCYGIKMINCYNTGTISVGNGCYGVGGLVGCAYTNNEVRLENCYNTGTIRSVGESNPYAGGIVGFVSADVNKVRLENCYNTGTISNPGAAYRTHFAGGIAGGVSFHEGAEGRLENCYNTGTIIGEQYTGGIVGDTYSAVGSEVGLKNCYNTGTIISKEYNTGGIVGAFPYNGGGKLENCYYLGATQGVGNRADEESGAINLLKDAQTESVELRPNDIKTIKNTEANVNLCANSELQKLGKGFKMEYVYSTPKDITISSPDTSNRLSISAKDGAKSGEVTLTGIRVTQNDLMANGYTGKTSTFDVNVTAAEKRFDVYIVYNLTLIENGGSWVDGSGPKTYKQGESSILPTDEDIKRDNCKLAGWSTQSDETGEILTEIPEDQVGNITLYAKWEEIKCHAVKIDFLKIEHGSILSCAEAESGTEVELTVIPDTNYELVEGSLKVTTEVSEEVEVSSVAGEPNKYIFRMPDSDVTVTARFERDPNYREIIIDPNNEHVTIKSEQYGRFRETVKVKVTPDEGYEVDRVYVNGEKQVLKKKQAIIEGQAMDQMQALEERKEQNFYYEFTFTMPDEDAIIKVTMQELDGWVRAPEKCEETGTPWWYYYKDDEKLTGWQEIEIQVEGREEQVQRYYFDPEKGNAAHTGWMKDENSNWYYFAVNHYRNATLLETPEQGLAMMWTGWANDGGHKWYYLDAVKQDFASGRGIMRTGWIQDGGKERYYFKSDDTQSSIYGSIVIGWGYIDGKWYYFTDDESENMRYYGQMQRGWQLIDGYWYYFYDDGAMASNTWIGDYFVDENGRWIS